MSTIDDMYKDAYKDGLKLFRADYSNGAESEYIYCGENHDNPNEEAVIAEAKNKTGTDYGDAGFKPCELLEVWEVDRTSECLNNIREIYNQH